MKIGVYSLPFHSNYGGILQSYALHIILRRLGHEVYVLNQNWLDRIGKRERIERAANFVLNVFTSNKRYTKREALIESISSLKEFWTTNIDHLIDFNKFSDIEKLGLDAIIVGSDQVWRSGYCKDSKWYFLNFTNGWNIKRIAYAASFGVSEWQFDKEITSDMKKLVSKFSGVSVRETDAVDLCEKYLDCSADLVFDPTLLLHKQDYELFRINKPTNSHKSLVSFMLHPNTEKKRLVKDVAENLNAELHDIDIPMSFNTNNISKYISVETWLTELFDADYVITDSYHGMVFSVNFNKPFVTVGNTIGGQARFMSFLKLFNLENRIATDKVSIIQLFKNDISWNEVNGIREKYYAFSINFIRESLKK